MIPKKESEEKKGLERERGNEYLSIGQSICLSISSTQLSILQRKSFIINESVDFTPSVLPTSVSINFFSPPTREWLQRWIHLFGPAGVGSVINYILLSLCSIIIYSSGSSCLPAHRFVGSNESGWPQWSASCFLKQRWNMQLKPHVRTDFCFDESNMSLRQEMRGILQRLLWHVCPC